MSLKTALAVNPLHVIIKLNFTKCLHKVCLRDRRTIRLDILKNMGTANSFKVFQYFLFLVI